MSLVTNHIVCDTNVHVRDARPREPHPAARDAELEATYHRHYDCYGLGTYKHVRTDTGTNQLADRTKHINTFQNSDATLSALHDSTQSSTDSADVTVAAQAHVREPDEARQPLAGEAEPQLHEYREHHRELRAVQLQPHAQHDLPLMDTPTMTAFPTYTRSNSALATPKTATCINGTRKPSATARRTTAVQP